MIILLLYVEAHIFILESLDKLGIYYRIMHVLLLFMHLLVVDYIIVIPYCITFLIMKITHHCRVLHFTLLIECT